ncbi:poly-gamma-glutamate hydrolase family protein [Halomarina litorea]|uniref:poly-gamma-glutamate hydrolase family protein n=1 Tax=Halomarina litorea TaxID=2961595 RepID=UPI0020C506AD|nr:poly-gamma-glutamate hydrolase family protein [Halomarina sp. BCD28]
MNDRTTRRTFLAAAGGAVAASSVATAGTGDVTTTRGDVVVRVSAGRWDDERCSLPGSVLDRYGLVTGQQVRLWYGGTCALFTVDRTDGDEAVVADDGAERLEAPEDDFTAELDTQVVDPAVDETTAREEGGFVEASRSGTDLLAVAPHGGYIEYGTGDQAERVADALGGGLWRCSGWSPGGGAYRRWHITSTDLHPDSLPALADVAEDAYRHAVAFHGWSNDGVGVGGGAPRDVLEHVRDTVREHADGAFPVCLVADPAYDGTDPDNVVNWLTEGGDGGVQLEQGWSVRTDHRDVVADAVVAAFDSL